MQLKNTKQKKKKKKKKTQKSNSCSCKQNISIRETKGEKKGKNRMDSR